LYTNVFVKPQRGFSLPEIIVTLAIAAILGGVLIPRIAGYVDGQRIDTTAATLNALAVSIAKFRSTVTDYPGRLSDLSTPIASGASTACNGIAPTTNQTYSPNDTKWTIYGPYYPKSISKTGFPLPIGVANDQITRTSANTTAGQIVITIPNVTIDDARDLNTKMDGDADQVGGNNTTGSIQYGAPPASKLVTVTFRMPAGNSC
jgi:prepilin-type N-terminal cleavage/methylation domain-containing protein